MSSAYGVGPALGVQPFVGIPMIDARQKTAASSTAPLVIHEDDVKRAVSATAIGNMMEWFDFGIYSYLAVVLGKVFFPESGSKGLIYSLAAFALAFLVRPIGGFFFGMLGDQIGRRGVLATTIIMMATATFSIGLIPNYTSIGIWAAILLYVARLVQGFSTGGEYSGASTFITEFAPDRQRGFLASFLEFGTITGFVSGAALVTGLTVALGDAAMVAWGWRIPFLVAGPLGVIGLFLRFRLSETPAFAEIEEQAHARSVESRLHEIVFEHSRALLLCMALVLALNVTNYLVLTYMPNYLTGTLGYDNAHSLFLNVLTMLAMLAAIPLVGRLGDRVGRRPVLLAACGGYLVLSWPALWLVQQGQMATILAGLLILGLCQTLFIGTTPSTLPAMFPTSIRYGGMSIAYNVSASLFGGTAPLMAETLVRVTGNDYMPAYYAMLAALVGLVAVLMMRETAQQPLEGSAPTISAHDAEKQKHGLEPVRAAANR
ncbi:MFS transporter [Bradyrhizobium cenepequi]|uniref:MFS transporter n=1 Tax=Bradyrhizobium cenepequi TaxID=2821403 RepID=UPI001CE3177D|nr:MFS transporter [Bradyrhizobium cenepequi]MCA6107051.1 MFS transporter [Bradyrhizobium cenepequi]